MRGSITQGSKVVNITSWPQKYMPNGTCGVISFGIKGGREAAAKFMESLKLASIVIHVADLRTCVLHPASTTHRQLTDEQLIEGGISADMIRMSVGIENPEDILTTSNRLWHRYNPMEKRVFPNYESFDS